jgi:dolichol-phosphate mannosyltransferase
VTDTPSAPPPDPAPGAAGRLRLALVIAAYDEAGNVSELADRLAAVLPGLPGYRSETLFVVRGSDGTRDLLRARGDVAVLDDGGAEGLAGAFRSGFARVLPGADRVATMDADLNHQPEDLPRLLAALEAREAEIVIGSRSVPGASVLGAPAWKRALSRTGNRLLSLLFGGRIRDRSSGYRVYRAAALARLPVEGEGFAFLPRMLLEAERLGLRVVEEPITFRQRRWGYSKLPVVATAVGYLRLLGGRFRRRGGPEIRR